MSGLLLCWTWLLMVMVMVNATVMLTITRMMAMLLQPLLFMHLSLAEYPLNSR